MKSLLHCRNEFALQYW